MALGRVVKYNKDKGYGFIKQLNTGEIYFCHVSNIDDGTLEVGYIVSFRGKFNAEENRTYAVKVQVVDSEHASVNWRKY